MRLCRKSAFFKERLPLDLGPSILGETMVLLHMFNEHRFPDKTLSTVLCRTAVRFLSGVRSSVSSQGAAVAESLVTVRILAYMRLFAGVSAQMHCQRRALRM